MKAILLINSDGGGRPDNNGGHGHFVCYSTDGGLVAVSQMTDGGAHPSSDCAIGCTLCYLMALLGISADGLTLEGDEQTTANGTLTENIPPTLALFGIASHVEQVRFTGAGEIMNPAWGGLIGPDGCQPYLDAQQGWAVIIDGVTGTPLSTEDDILTPGMKAGLARLAVATARGDSALTADEQAWWVATLADDGSNFDALVQQMYAAGSVPNPDNPTADTGSAWFAKLRTAVEDYPRLKEWSDNVQQALTTLQGAMTTLQAAVTATRPTAPVPAPELTPVPAPTPAPAQPKRSWSSWWRSF